MPSVQHNPRAPKIYAIKGESNDPTV
jgi:hypothetical protein